MAASSDAPNLDIAYKLTEYAGKGRMKLSAGKRSLPGRKQVFREFRDGVAVRDVIAREAKLCQASHCCSRSCCQAAGSRSSHATFRKFVITRESSSPRCRRICECCNRVSRAMMWRSATNSPAMSARLARI